MYVDLYMVFSVLVVDGGMFYKAKSKVKWVFSKDFMVDFIYVL